MAKTLDFWLGQIFSLARGNHKVRGGVLLIWDGIELLYFMIKHNRVFLFVHDNINDILFSFVCLGFMIFFGNWWILWVMGKRSFKSGLIFVGSRYNIVNSQYACSFTWFWIPRQKRGKNSALSWETRKIRGIFKPHFFPNF